MFNVDAALACGPVEALNFVDGSVPGSCGARRTVKPADPPANFFNNFYGMGGQDLRRDHGI